MLKAIQIVIILLIILSLILQILVLFGNYRGLRKVNIIRVELNNNASGGSDGFLGGIFDKVTNSLDNQIPDLITVALFIICQEDKASETVCTPPTFGFRYQSTGILDLIQKEISSSLHSTISGIQKGIFILSAAICFFLLLCTFYHQCSTRKQNHKNSSGFCRTFFIIFISWIALLFAMATFIAQLVMYNLARSTIYSAKDKILGGLLNGVVNVQVKTGASVWLSLVAFISLVLVTILLIFSLCFLNKRKRRNEKYEMGPVAASR